MGLNCELDRLDKVFCMFAQAVIVYNQSARSARPLHWRRRSVIICEQARGRRVAPARVGHTANTEQLVHQA